MSKYSTGKAVRPLLVSGAFVGAYAALLGCRTASPPEPTPSASALATTAASAPGGTPSTSTSAAPHSGDTAASPQPLASSTPQVELEVPSEADPKHGKFSLAEATAGLPQRGALRAVLQTSQGDLSCQLFDDKAPNTVANFIGLARGKRPWLKNGKWVSEPLYDGTSFYQALKNFAIEGGSPSGEFGASIGYVIADEVPPKATHNARGLLCMRGRKPNQNGSAFMILDGPAPQLDGSFTIFGSCGPSSVLDKLVAPGATASTPARLLKVTIAREPAK